MRSFNLKSFVLEFISNEVAEEYVENEVLVAKLSKFTHRASDKVLIDSNRYLRGCTGYKESENLRMVVDSVFDPLLG